MSFRGLALTRLPPDLDPGVGTLSRTCGRGGTQPARAGWVRASSAMDLPQGIALGATATNGGSFVRGSADNYEDLEYRAGRLHWSRGSAVAAVGRSGVKADKHEGDGATPAGTYPLVSIFYRPDRVALPASALPVTPLAPNHGWVDAPGDAELQPPRHPALSRQRRRDVARQTAFTMRWW